MHQLTLSFRFDENALKAYLEKSTNKAVSLVITDNTASMLSLKTGKRAASIRLHRMFLSAGVDVLDEIAGFIKDNRRKTPLLRDYINRNTHLLEKIPARKQKIRTQGRHFNLQEIFDSLNRGYFKDMITASITWGTKGPKLRVRRRTLGSYVCHNDLIRINSILDSKRIPKYFLEFIVYHEMLHADMGIERTGDRRSIHCKEFKRRERLYKQYERAIEWEKKRW